MPTEGELYAAAAKARRASEIVLKIPDQAYEKILNELRRKITVRMEGEEACLEGGEHVHWLVDAKPTIDWKFWSRYEKYLRLVRKRNRNLIDALDKTSDEILDLICDPRSKESFSKRGLIIGAVQSGKTANYTAVCCKAADAGYKIIVVLTGMLEDLRRQTQQRLDIEFADTESDMSVIKLTTDENDVNRMIPRQVGIGIGDVTKPVLLVVKKNKLVLDSLIEWLRRYSLEPADGMIHSPLLLIDDEADNASINTNDGNTEPTAINACIRGLLMLFRQSAYIGITATPFANIFINPVGNNEMLGSDLFPRDFIYALDVPNDYIGAEKIFGNDDSEYARMLVPIEPEEAPDVEKIFPKRHKSSLAVENLPDSLLDAVNYFLLVNAVLDARGLTSHRTMLIHVSRFIAVHDKIYNLIADRLERIKCEIEEHARLDDIDADKSSPMLASLRKTFDRFDLERLGGMTWEELRKNYLHDAVKPIRAGLRNGCSGERAFDYRDEPSGLRIIAIGGTGFSRGLTLEGLCVSYFYRNSMMYDTLMQMGRWFGYRDGFADLCRIWTSRELIDWYGFITRACSELIDEIKLMQRLGRTPSDFGLKVRQSPDALMITARNKMRLGREIRHPVSLSRQFLETPRLVSDQSVLDGNKRLILNFVSELDRRGKFDGGGKLFWRGVDKNFVAELIEKFETHAWHLSYQGAAIARYIREKMNDAPWDVMIPEGSGAPYDELPLARPIKPNVRRILVDENSIMISGTKVRVGSGGLARNGLRDDQIRAVEENFRSDPSRRSKAVPDKAFMIEGRRPILFVYVIEVREPERFLDVPKILFAIGVGIPDSGRIVRTVDYIINPIGYSGYLIGAEEDIEE